MTTRRLTSRQHDVLRRLAAGEIISRSDSALAVTVYALRNRQLVTTARAPGGRWIAELTDAGRLAAETGRVPVSLPRPSGRATRHSGRPRPPTESLAPAAPKPDKKRKQRQPSSRKTVVIAVRAALKGRADEKGLFTPLAMPPFACR